MSSSENKRFEGLNLLQCARLRKTSIYELVREWIKEEGFGVLLIFLESPSSDESINHPLVIHEKSCLGSDGIFHEGSPVHPRVYGSFPRVLGRYVRERKLLTLEEAIRKMSAFPCEIFGFGKRGYIEEGAYADLVIFDPEEIRDHATFSDPHQLSTGVSEVFVNGVLIFEDQQRVHRPDEPLPGRFLKSGQGDDGT